MRFIHSLYITDVVNLQILQIFFMSFPRKRESRRSRWRIGTGFPIRSGMTITH